MSSAFIWSAKASKLFAVAASGKVGVWQEAEKDEVH